VKHLATIQSEFLKSAVVFPSQIALYKYRKQHPKADMRHHTVEQIGTERHTQGQSSIMTPDRGWVYFDQDDEGRKELEEERRHIKSFLENRKEFWSK
jgi:hypothetical protein